MPSGGPCVFQFAVALSGLCIYVLYEVLIQIIGALFLLGKLLLRNMKFHVASSPTLENGSSPVWLLWNMFPHLLRVSASEFMAGENELPVSDSQGNYGGCRNLGAMAFL